MRIDGQTNAPSLFQGSSSTKASSFTKATANFNTLAPFSATAPAPGKSPAPQTPGSGFIQNVSSLITQLQSVATNFQTASASTQQRVALDKGNGRGVLENARAYTSEVVGGLQALGAAKSAGGFLGGGASGALGAASGWTGTINAVGNLVSLFSAGDNVKPGSAALSGAVNGAYIGTQILPGWGTAIGAVVGGIAGFASSYFGSGKSEDQKARDQVRAGLQQAGVIDEKYNLTLANGEKFDIGKDGGAKLQNVDGTERRMYEVDMGNPLMGQAIGFANPLAQLVSGGDKKLASSFAGYFANAAISNAKTPEDVRQNMLTIFSKFNASPEQTMAALQQLGSAGKITGEEFAAFANGMRTMMGS
jgi:hypothetical protein